MVTWIPPEEDRLSQKKKAGLVEAVVEEEETWCKAWWGKDQIELRKVKDTEEACRLEGIAFLPFAVETLGGLHSGAVAQVRQLAAALARCKGVEEGEVTSQIFGRLSLALMRANGAMISSRCQDTDFPLTHIDGIE